MKGYVAVQKKLLVVMLSIWKNDLPYDRGHEERLISGDDKQEPLFPFFSEGESKKVVPQLSSTTQDKLRYDESQEALFPLLKLKNISDMACILRQYLPLQSFLHFFRYASGIQKRISTSLHNAKPSKCHKRIQRR
ncbi:MAG: transposase [Sphingobacteriales bacterium]|nr:transposase [Sphingobacteriales bacterium]